MSGRSRSKRSHSRRQRKENDFNEIEKYENLMEIVPSRNDIAHNNLNTDTSMEDYLNRKRKDYLSDVSKTRFANSHYIPLTCFGVPLCHDITLMDEIPSSIDVPCWHCDEYFDSQPIIIPTGYDKKNNCIIGNGVACSAECAWAHIENEIRNDEELKQELVILLKIQMHNLGFDISKMRYFALPRHVKKKYNPTFGITEKQYHKDNIVEQNQPLYKQHFSLLPQILEANASILEKTNTVVTTNSSNENHEEEYCQSNENPILAASTSFEPASALSIQDFFEEQIQQIYKEPNMIRKQNLQETYDLDCEKHYGKSHFDIFLSLNLNEQQEIWEEEKKMQMKSNSKYTTKRARDDSDDE